VHHYEPGNHKKHIDPGSTQPKKEIFCYDRIIVDSRRGNQVETDNSNCGECAQTLNVVYALNNQYLRHDLLQATIERLQKLFGGLPWGRVATDEQ